MRVLIVACWLVKVEQKPHPYFADMCRAVRTSFTSDTCRIVTGGASGHEPNDSDLHVVHGAWLVDVERDELLTETDQSAQLLDLVDEAMTEALVDGAKVITGGMTAHHVGVDDEGD